MPKNKNKNKNKNKKKHKNKKNIIDSTLAEPNSTKIVSEKSSQELAQDLCQFLGGSASASGDGNTSSVIRVPGGEGSSISMENVKQALADFNFHVKDVGESASEITIPGAVSSGKEIRVNVIQGGDKEDGRMLTALLYDTPDKISSYYMHHPDKYFFKNEATNEEINLFQLAAYFGAIKTIGWLFDTNKFDVDSVNSSGKNAIWYALRFYGEPLLDFREEDLADNQWINKKSKVLSFLLKSVKDGGAGASLNFPPVDSCLDSSSGDMLIVDAWDAFFDLHKYLKVNNLEVQAYGFVNSMLNWDLSNIEHSSLCLLGNVDEFGNAVPHYERFLNSEGDFFCSCKKRVFNIINNNILFFKNNLEENQDKQISLEHSIEKVTIENKELSSEISEIKLLQEENKDKADSKKSTEIDKKLYVDSQNEIKNALNQIEALKRNNENLQKQLDLKNSAYLELSQKNKILMSQKDIYQIELYKEKESKKNYVSQHLSKEKELRKKIDGMSDVSLKNSTLEASNKGFKKDVSKLLEKLSIIEREYMSLEVSFKSEKIKNSELTKKLDLLQSESLCNSNQLLDLNRYIEHLNKELYAIQQQNIFLKHQNQELGSELSYSNSSLVKLEGMYGAQISELRHKLASLKSNQSLKKNIESKSGELSDSRSKVCLLMAKKFVNEVLSDSLGFDSD